MPVGRQRVFRKGKELLSSRVPHLATVNASANKTAVAVQTFLATNLIA